MYALPQNILQNYHYKKTFYRHMNQWNRMRNKEVNLHMYVEVIFHMILSTHNGEKIISSTDGVKKIEYL